MLEEIFNIKSFNILSDDNYYYFFRALNNRDHNDVVNNIICDENGVHTIFTDREHYNGESKYTNESVLSLEEVYDHIKYNHRIDTNCISLTWNASVALLYGKEFYNDEYVIIKVPKEDLGNNTVFAGLYMLEEINKKLDEYKEDELIRYYFELIDNCPTQKKLDEIILKFSSKTIEEEIFQKGIEYIKPIFTSEYSSLSKEQNLEKNKIVAKINVINRQLFPNISNKLLIQTIGLAFSSLELVHYKKVNKSEIINCSSSFIDIIAILQQIDNPLSRELQLLLINNVNKLNLTMFEYENYDLGNIDLDLLYNLSNGGIEYLELKNYINLLFYLAKSKLRCLSIIENLKKITNGDPKYEYLYDSIIKSCYGIEYQIISKNNNNKNKIIESIGFDISDDNIDILDYINNLNNEDLIYILNNKYDALKKYIYSKEIELKIVNKDRWLSFAIIDSFNWRKLNIERISYKQKKELADKLIEKNLTGIYSILKNNEISNKDISNVLLTYLIKNKSLDINDIDINDTFTISQIENFLGYYKIIDSEIILKDYQGITVKNINTIHKKYKFCGAIMPTGGGKSFIALVEMLLYKDKRIIYVAPNDIILEQIEDYIVEYIRGKEGTFGKYTSIKNRKNIIREIFPNLTLITYQKINISKAEREKQYDFIVLDEIHRSGATDWIKSITELLDNQQSYIRILGLTATPTRDCDGMDMMNYWAKHFGYTKKEILRHKHLAINMDIYEAIKLGYVVNPKVVSCAYDLINDNGEMSTLLGQINNLKDLEKKNELYEKYNELRKKVEDADGVEQILNKYLRKGKKYIVFCPVKNSAGNIVEDEDGNIIDSRITGDDVINKYTNLLTEYLGKDNIECYSMLASYSVSKNRRQRELFEMGNNDKISFLIVMDKANEGMHIKNDGLIWFRAIDEQSIILCSQQFGRIVYALEPGQVIDDDDLPLAIDLTNNLIRIKLNKNNVGTKVDDLDKLKQIQCWIMEYGKYPDINSSNKIESRYASILKHIQVKYKKYFNVDLFNKLSDDDKEYISEILEIGNSIDLWNIILHKKDNRKVSKERNDELFALSGLLQDFYELKMEVERNIVKLTFEEKVEELYEYCIKEGKYVKKTSSEQFSDGSKISFFINYAVNINKIIEYAKTNEHAKYIVKVGHLDKTPLEYKIEVTMNRIIYLYNHYVTTSMEIPKNGSKEKFPDGSEIYNWLRRDELKILFKDLIALKYDYVKEVYEYLGWNCQLSSTDILKIRLNEVNERYLSVDGKLPKKLSNDTFSGGGIIYGYLKRNRREITTLAEEGNAIAKRIIELGFYKGVKEKSEDLFEERINYIYENYILKNIPIPRRDSDDIFPKSKAHIWAWIKQNKERILKLIETNDIRVQQYVEYFKPLIANFKTEESFLEELKYFAEKIKTCGNISSAREGLFPNGKIVSNWYYTRMDDIKIYAKNGNSDAKYILKSREKQNNKGCIEDRIKYLYENYILKNIPLPTTRDVCFDDGAVILGWISRKNVRHQIKILAINGDENALALAKSLNFDLDNIEIKEEDLICLNYVVDNYLNRGLSIPSSNSKVCFNFSGNKISEWIHSSREIIKYLAQLGNKNAQLVVDYYDWNGEINKFIQTAKNRLHYVYENYVKINKKIPQTSSKERFGENEITVGLWIRMSKVKDFIKKLVLEGNEEAIAVYKHAEWDVFLTREEQFLKRLEYIYEKYICRNISLLSLKANDKFIDNVTICTWIKNNKEQIINLSKSNEYARLIMEECKLNVSIEERYQEQTIENIIKKLTYIYNNYILTNKGIPKYDSNECFEDGSPIYKWLNRGRTKKEIESLALSGNEIAIRVMEKTTWGKKNIKSILEVNEIALESAIRNGWVLERDAANYSAYKKLQKNKK